MVQMLPVSIVYIVNMYLFDLQCLQDFAIDILTDKSMNFPL